MDEEDIIEDIKNLDALLEGHFVFTSGRHGNAYVNKDLISTEPPLLADLAEESYEQIKDLVDQGQIQVVACAAVGAIPFAVLLARRCVVLFAYAEPFKGELSEGLGPVFAFYRGFDQVVRGKKVLVAEDIITPGGTVEAVKKAVEELGGEVVGISCIWLRGENTFTVPLEALVTKQFPSWSAQECLPCRNGIPISIEVGHGREFLQEFGENPANWPANRRK